MEKIQEVFKRYEKKYLLTDEQYKALQKVVGNRLILDEFGKHTICNIYFDTPNYELIRTSIEKPHYKEKLRLRSYGVPKVYSQVFIELKKKFDGIVYKRRVPMCLADAEKYLYEGRRPSETSQIIQEVDWFVKFYQPKPTVFLGYDRMAYFGREQEEFRVTFDTNIRYREEKLHLAEGDAGELLMKDGTVLMEVKIPDSMPFWFGHILSDLGIFPISFSKYGDYYKQNVTHLFEEGILYAG
ncbi:MAG: polyphosphate polymerase domain-containing protein [Clostridia bacterium]|nr:polyphosphate polymerase domain-containing protein [Lachnospiraceae bacterium]NCC00481.1 polyphosphate polymerase domain-containing protein [Clostridia bacterium]NCD02492.1 polyphosphate polymerase domain-containing protein [Clostridia bacterium]